MNKRHCYSIEEEKWIKTNIPSLVNSKVPYSDIVLMFNNKFSCNVSLPSLFRKAYRIIGYFSEHQIRNEWLLENSKNYPLTKQGTEMFRKDYNKKFNRKVNKESFNQLMFRLKIKRLFNYTDEQKKRLINNCNGIRRNVLTKKFNEKFGTYQTIEGIRTLCQRRLKVHNGLNHKMLKGEISPLHKPIGTLRRIVEKDRIRYRYKVSQKTNNRTKNRVCIPKEIVENNALVSNCIEAFAIIKALEMKIKF